MQQKSIRFATIIATLLACVALQGCGTMGDKAATGSSIGASGPPPRPSYPPTNCDDAGGNCMIKVHVDRCQFDQGIKVDLPYASTHKGAVMIWTIEPSWYAFAINGIDFGSSPGFVPLPNQPNPRHIFKVRNDADARVDPYYYYVNVVGCKQLDPWIKNN